METREAEDAAKLGALRAAAKAGDDAFERGNYTTFPDADAAVSHLRAIGDRVIRGKGVTEVWDISIGELAEAAMYEATPL